MKRSSPNKHHRYGRMDANQLAQQFKSRRRSQHRSQVNISPRGQSQRKGAGVEAETEANRVSENRSRMRKRSEGKVQEVKDLADPEAGRERGGPKIETRGHAATAGGLKVQKRGRKGGRVVEKEGLTVRIRIEGLKVGREGPRVEKGKGTLDIQKVGGIVVTKIQTSKNKK